MIYCKLHQIYIEHTYTLYKQDNNLSPSVSVVSISEVTCLIVATRQLLGLVSIIYM